LIVCQGNTKLVATGRMICVSRQSFINCTQASMYYAKWLIQTC